MVRSDGAATGRTLNGPGYANGTAMTQESCVTFCDSQGYNFAGVEYSQECCKLLSARPIIQWIRTLSDNGSHYRLRPEPDDKHERTDNGLQHGLYGQFDRGMRWSKQAESFLEWKATSTSTGDKPWSERVVVTRLLHGGYHWTHTHNGNGCSRRSWKYDGSSVYLRLQKCKLHLRRS